MKDHSVSRKPGSAPGSGRSGAQAGDKNAPPLKDTRADGARLPAENGAVEAADTAGSTVIPIPPAERRRVSAPRKAPGASLEDQIGRHLKAMYEDVLKQPIPDRFVDLVEKLAIRTSSGGNVDGSK